MLFAAAAVARFKRALADRLGLDAGIRQICHGSARLLFSVVSYAAKNVWERVHMLGFKLDVWDYLTFAVVVALIGAFLAVAVFVLGLPGRIAIARKHPDADAINMMGYLGFLAVVPWMQAFMWAFKPTDVVDIRYFPRQEQQSIDEMLARIKGKTASEKKPETKEPPSRIENEPNT
jgi:hypothetical protein